MATNAPDLAQLIQRRELQAYEQRMARVAYAYGVDLRRSHWLDASTLGEPLLRTVDRRWGSLIADLERDVFEPPARLPGWLLEEIADVTSLLRAPLPTVRLVSEAARQRSPWPAATPLGTTKGGMQWIVLDVAAVSSLQPAVRRFVLAAAAAHLQCEHGPLFTAHLMAARSRFGLSAVRRVLAPWTRVAVFSADRAGLLAALELPAALAGIRAQLPSATVPFWPRFPVFELRERALQDFERSAVVARMRRLNGQPQQARVIADQDEAAAQQPEAEPVTTSPYWSLARCDERLTRKLGLF